MDKAAFWKKGLISGVLLGCLLLAGCGGGAPAESAAENSTEHGKLQGDIRIDGSSTVYLVSRAMAEEFMNVHGDVNITVSSSGTGGGFKKLVAGELDICDASRPVSEEELAALKDKNIEFLEIPFAFDGLSVMINKENTFAESLTTAELKSIWEGSSQINNWKEVRAGFPDLPLKLYGPGTDSGTFEYFTEAINQKKKSSRSDYTNSEDDNIIINGVAGDQGALGYCGYAYFMRNTDKVKAVKIDSGKGPVEPTEKTVKDGTYTPLSRPLFIYVRKEAFERPEVRAFIDFYLSADSRKLIAENYICLPEKAYAEVQKRVKSATLGTAFIGTKPGATIEDVLRREAK